MRKTFSLPVAATAAGGGGSPPQPPSSDTDFENVSLLLHGDGTNGAQNNTFVDSSTNNFTITRAGNTTQGTFSPFSPTGWSGYFDGTGDYLSVADNAALQMGSGDFTIEFWINFSSITGYVTPFNKGYTSAGGLLFQSGNGNGRMVIYVGGTAVITETGTASTGTWIHYALVRNGSTLTLYRDGTSSGSATNSTNINNTSTLYIGSSVTTTPDFPITGYISNLRIVKGTAVYTSAFTPPTTPLTAIPNTSLLTLQDNRFKDNSTNNFTITRNGDTKIEPFSPFNPTAAYSASAHGGSAYLDGTGDYLTTAASNENNFGTSDFTIEFWINSTKTTRSDPFGWNYSYSSAGWAGFIFNLSSSGDMAWYEQTSSRISASATGWNNGAWNHVALTRSGNSVRMFLNGTQVGSTYTTSFSYGANSSGFIVGDMAGGGGPVNGYISGLRVLKGTAQYTSNFTPPTAPVTAITNTSLLLNFTNAGIIDNASKNVLETVGNAQISTSVKKFGTGSLAFDGTGDYLFHAPVTNNAAFGTGDFTIETWFYPLSNQPQLAAIVAAGNQTGAGQSWQLYFSNSSNTISFSDYSTVLISAAGSISNSTWTHIALTRSGTTLRLFLDGVQSSSATSSLNLTPLGQGIKVGQNAFTASNLNGYIDDLRITKGVARYTANFTPPTQAFPDL